MDVHARPALVRRFLRAGSASTCAAEPRHVLSRAGGKFWTGPSSVGKSNIKENQIFGGCSSISVKFLTKLRRTKKKKRRPKKRRRNFEFPISVFSFPLEWRVHTSGETKPAVVYIAALFDGVLTSKMMSVHSFNISQRAVILMQSISEALE